MECRRQSSRGGSGLRRSGPTARFCCGQGFSQSFLWFFYTNTVMSSSSMVSGFPVAVFGVIGTAVLLASVAVIWRHNQLVYPRAYDYWERSFVCQRCGAVTAESGTSLVCAEAWTHTFGKGRRRG